MKTDNKTYYYVAHPQVSGYPTYYGKKSWIERKIKDAPIPYSKTKEAVNHTEKRRKIEGSEK